MLRIITGQYKGRMLKTPPGIRPTEDRIRKSLFDIIDPRDCDFLELFAGSGSVGLEALSRGASRVVFVEKERACVKVLQENILKLVAGGGADRAELLPYGTEEAVLFLSKQSRRFDIIFLDPPYYRGFSEKTLQLLGGYDILHHSGLVIVQHYRKDALSERVGDLVFFRRSRYGDSLLSFYQKSEQNVQKSDLPGHV